jgi:NADH-quinone oxidoreductase subunit E
MDAPCFDKAALAGIVARYPREEPSLLLILQDVQRAFGFLPCEALTRVAGELGVPLASVFSVATFYRAFSLTPAGRTVVKVCTGTACHIRGAERLVEQLTRELGIGPGETTADLAFGVKTVNCVGACAMAPVLIVGERYHGNAEAAQVAAYLTGATHAPAS